MASSASSSATSSSAARIVRRIAAELNADPDFDFYCFIDSVANLRNIEHHLEGIALSHPIKLLLDFGAMGGRTGVRTLEQAKDAGERHPRRRPDKIPLRPAWPASKARCPVSTRASQPVRTSPISRSRSPAACRWSSLRGLDEFIVSSGGSSYFDIIAEHFKTLKLDLPIRVLLRSGCYVTHDFGSLRRRRTIEAEADPHRHGASPNCSRRSRSGRTCSRCPEPGLGFLTMGKRDIPFDAGLPVPLKRYRPGVGLPRRRARRRSSPPTTSTPMCGSAQGTDWQVGDLVASGISHPCTAFDKWRFIPVVDDDYTVIDGVLTFF